MSERKPGAEISPESRTDRAWNAIATTKRSAEIAIAKGRQILEDPKIQENQAVVIRTVLNALIASSDFIPGIPGSWGADAAKMWARYQHAKEKKRAEEEGRDPKKVKLSAIDLTPDVSVESAVFTQLIGVCSGGMLPTHIIESVKQLRHDWSKLKDTARRLKEIIAGTAEVRSDEVEAAEVFDVELTNKEE